MSVIERGLFEELFLLLLGSVLSAFFFWSQAESPFQSEEAKLFGIQHQEREMGWGKEDKGGMEKTVKREQVEESRISGGGPGA